MKKESGFVIVLDELIEELQERIKEGTIDALKQFSKDAIDDLKSSQIINVSTNENDDLILCYDLEEIINFSARVESWALITEGKLVEAKGDNAYLIDAINRTIKALNKLTKTLEDSLKLISNQ